MASEYGAEVYSANGKTIFMTDDFKYQLIGEMRYIYLTDIASPESNYNLQITLEKNLDPSKLSFVGYPTNAYAYPDSFTYTADTGVLTFRINNLTLDNFFVSWGEDVTITTGPSFKSTLKITSPEKTLWYPLDADGNVVNVNTFNAFNVGKTILDTIWPRIYIFYWG